MMRFGLAIALAGVIAAPVPVREYRIDAGHTDVAFSIGFLGHPVRGRFDDVRGTIAYAATDPGASGVTVVIATKSISTGSAHRDEHLRSPDFFDAAKFPAIVFRSVSIVRRGDALVATGPLTMHGVTRTVVIPFRETIAPVADPHGSNLVFFSGRLRIARKDFAILGGSKYNDWFDELRSAAMGDTVDVTLDVAGWQPDPMRAKPYDDDTAAQALHARGRTAEAIALLRAASEKADGSAPLHSALARLYELAGNDSAAKAQTSRALALDSLDTRALELARRLNVRR